MYLKSGYIRGAVSLAQSRNCIATRSQADTQAVIALLEAHSAAPECLGR